MEATTFLSTEQSLWNLSTKSYDETINGSYAQANNTNIANFSNGSRSAQSVADYYPIIAFEMTLSCVLLVFSMAVYCTLSEFRNVHGKNLISMSACLLTTFLMLILDLIIRKHIPFVACFTIAIIIHVTFLGAFFWTNVMAFDIWKSLTDMKCKTKLKGHQSKKYLKYSIYAWTATILTALPAAILELTDWLPKEYRPKFGERRCWLSGKTAFIFYFNMPVGVILFTNLVMFLLTIRKLLIIKKMTAVLNVKQHQRRLNLYLKLFLIMGITWTAEFLPWVTGIYSLYALAGMLTALHGCYLFFIFVCKKRILVQFFEKVRTGMENPSSSQNTSSQHVTSSSDNNRKKSFDNLGNSKF